MKMTRQFLIAIIGLASGLTDLDAQMTSGFETSNGAYVVGNSISGVNDTAIGASWTTTGIAPVSSSDTPREGSLAIRLNDTSTSMASNATINLANAASILTSEFEFKLSMNIRSISSDGTGLQAQFYLGAATSGNANHWIRIDYDDSSANGINDGNLRLFTGNGSSDTALSWAYSNFSSIGNWLDFDIRIDPTTKKFTSVIIGGVDKTTEVLASNGGTVPWDSVAGVTPGAGLALYTGGNDLVAVDFDALSVSAVPEPAVLSLLLSVVLFMTVVRRSPHSRFDSRVS